MTALFRRDNEHQDRKGSQAHIDGEIYAVDETNRRGYVLSPHGGHDASC